jgi:SAM-dependent methyltransferase
MVDYAAASAAFTHIYDAAIWGGGSGASAPEITQPYIKLLQDFMRLNGVSSVVDVGCGDWQFSRVIDWSGVDYKGFDVVPTVIAQNNKVFARKNVSFCTVTSLHALPPADLVVCKDVLQHLPIEDIASYLAFFETHYKFALITNDRAAVEKTPDGDRPIPDSWINAQTEHGGWRTVQLDKPPFNAASTVLLEWDVEAPTMRWTKQVCLIVGKKAEISEPKRSRWLERLAQSATPVRSAQAAHDIEIIERVSFPVHASLPTIRYLISSSRNSLQPKPGGLRAPSSSFS